MKSKALLFVAHPDDEFLFGYNLITESTHRYDWTVVCATYNGDSQRGDEFNKSCKIMGVTPILLGFMDDMYSKIGLDKIREPIEDVPLVSDFNFVVTHNPFGEYGHPHHIECNKFIMRNISKSQEVWVFAQNYSIPSVRCNNISKKDCDIMKVYEREQYLLFNFDLISEGFTKVQLGT